MPVNERKIISIILKECDDIDERCDGYKEEIINVISDILIYERRHRVSAMNIQKKINDKFNAAARFLYEQSGRDVDSAEPES